MYIKIFQQLKVIATILILFVPNIGFSAENGSKNLPTKNIKNIDAQQNLDSKDLYRDIDQDGVIDKYDFCLNTGSGYRVDKNGCELDSDEDGVYDRTDQCPGTVLGAKINFLGCEADEDFDLVLNSRDKCPKTRAGVRVDEDGCQVNASLVKKELCSEDSVDKVGCELKKIVISNIVFDSSSYDIRPDQLPILGEGIYLLDKRNLNQIIIIKGYTDSSGSSELNVPLSWHRAKAIKDYLVETVKYNEDKVFIIGKSSDSPVASNITTDGRQQNRRIEFSVVNKEQVPEGALLTIPDELKEDVRVSN